LHDRFTAPDLIQDVAREVDGKGGGRPDLAQAGGNDPAGIERAVARLKEILAQ
ncbi:MAG: DHHA1 domain-containing protein, partial [Desulfovermiculus sp.]